MIKKIIYVVQLLRAKQWIKNAFILFPLVFAGRVSHGDLLWNTLKTFLGFCCVASSVYILNDLLDIKSDRLHPKKSKRPLAQGHITKPVAITLSILLIILGLLICWNVGLAVLYTALTYTVIHLIYNLYAKSVVIIDVIFVAAGFQIRIWAGSFAASVIPSVWLQMCVFLLALFLGFTKRRYEIAALKDKASEHRNVLAHYTSYLLDQVIIICSTLTIVFYSLYAMSSDIITRNENLGMVYSAIFVIYGIFRYLYLVHVKKLGDDPGEVIFSDPPLILNIFLWAVYILFILYRPV